MKEKRYITSPLLFQGQKRKFVKAFRELLSGMEEPKVIVDPAAAGCCRASLRTYSRPPG